MTYLTVSGAEKNRLARTAGWTWDIPYCAVCKGHIKAVDRVALLGLSMLATSIVIGAIIFILSGQLGFGIEVLVSLLASSAVISWLLLITVRSRMSPDCRGLTRAVQYLGSNGSCHTFEFRSRVYGAEFARSNQRKLVNISPLVASLLRNFQVSDKQLPRRFVKRRRPH